VTPALPRHARCRQPALGLETSRALWLSTTIGALVFGAGGVLPPGAAYYVGLEVAKQLGRRYTLRELARLEGPRLRDEIAAALRAIETTAP